MKISLDFYISYQKWIEAVFDQIIWYALFH